MCVHVCACVCGVCGALKHEGQHLKLNDVVTRDLNRCGQEESWRERSHHRDSWPKARNGQEHRRAQHNGCRWRSKTRRMGTGEGVQRERERERELQFETAL